MLTELLESGRTVRYHTDAIMIRYMQSNADHQWGVAQIILALHPNPSMKLVREALNHDAGERWIGDLCGPGKRRHPVHAREQDRIEREICADKGISRPWLTDLEEAWIHFADRLESHWFMQRVGCPRDNAMETASALLSMAQELQIADADVAGLLQLQLN